ncbi:GMP/IMP nucleotidase, partial [Klebsiella pneumoniae subsp. pneumoniae]
MPCRPFPARWRVIMHFDIAWQEVDTVLLDMDGT